MKYVTRNKRFGVLTETISKSLTTRWNRPLGCASCGTEILVGEIYFSNKGSRNPKYYHMKCAKKHKLV